MAILLIVSSLGLTGSAFMQSTEDEIKDTNRFKITMKIGAWLDEDGYSIEAPRDEVDVTLSYVNNKYMEYIEKKYTLKKKNGWTEEISFRKDDIYSVNAFWLTGQSIEDWEIPENAKNKDGDEITITLNYQKTIIQQDPTEPAYGVPFNQKKIVIETKWVDNSGKDIAAPNGAVIQLELEGHTEAVTLNTDNQWKQEDLTILYYGDPTDIGKVTNISSIDGWATTHVSTTDSEGNLNIVVTNTKEEVEAVSPSQPASPETEEEKEKDTESERIEEDTTSTTTTSTTSTSTTTSTTGTTSTTTTSTTVSATAATNASTTASAIESSAISTTTEAPIGLSDQVPAGVVTTEPETSTSEVVISVAAVPTTLPETTRTFEFIDIFEEIPLGVKTTAPIDFEEILIEEAVPLSFATTNPNSQGGSDGALASLPYTGSSLPYTASGAVYLFIGFGMLAATIGITMKKRM